MKRKVFSLTALFCLALSLSTVFSQGVDPLNAYHNVQEVSKTNEGLGKPDNDNAEQRNGTDLISPMVPEKLTLVEAFMCEALENLVPVNPAVVFSISAESICCFSAFDPVPEKTIIFHKWYRKDQLSTTQSLAVEPPRWRTYSSIQLREADKGPWRVEIVGPKGQVMKILRFSITD
jgi:hypothetical protein